MFPQKGKIFLKFAIKQHFEGIMYQLIKDFIIIYIVAIIGSCAVDYITKPYGFDLYSSLPLYIEYLLTTISIIVFCTITPAYVGIRYTKRHAAAPTPKLAWELGLFTMPIIVVSGLIWSCFFMFLNPDILDLYTSELANDELLASVTLSQLTEIIYVVMFTSTVFLSIILFFIMLIHILLIRWIFPLSARLYLKRIER